MTRKYDKNARCYNCGEPMPLKVETDEHIPMHCILRGVDSINWQSVVKVPACEKCNHEYSLKNHKIRDLIAVIGQIKGKLDLKKIIGAASRSLVKNEEFRGWFFKNENGDIGFRFATDDFNILHIKNMKGLFYHEFGYPLPDEFQCYSLSDNGIIDTSDDLRGKYVDITRRMSERREDWKASGGLNIFKYRIGLNYCYERPRALNNNDIVFCEMWYHDLIYANVMACDKTIAQKLSNNQGT